MKYICLIFTIVCLFLTVQLVRASTADINATVKLSVCGNGIKEPGEDCDNADLDGKTCESLGFDGGTLACDIGCGFETASCTIPAIDPINVAPSDVVSLVAAGLFNIPGSASLISTPILTTVTNIAVVVPVAGGVSKVVIPASVVIARVDGDYINPTTLTVAPVVASQVSGLTGKEAKAVLQWGLTDATLGFSDPITIDVYVGTDLNGDTLDVVRSTALVGGWTNEGIVAPATCVVSAGVCTFQATKASYYAAVKPIATPVPTATSTSSTSTSSSSNSSGATTTTITTPLPIAAPARALPAALQIFDINGDGRIPLKNLSDVVKIWVDSWKSVINRYTGVGNLNCDINKDRECNMRDFSILMFYVGR